MYYDDKKMDFTDKMTVDSRSFSPSSGNGNGKGSGLRISIFLHSRFENNSFRHYIREFVCDCQPCNMSERGGRMENRETWSGNFGFIMATIGSAIGLGNVWKFPYITGMNGGGAFVIVYIICVLLLGVPVMICEMNIGRKTGLNAYGAYKRLELRRSRIGRFIAAGLILGGLCLMGAGSYGFGTVSVIAGLIVLKLGFAAFGLLAIFGALVILSYYAVVGGWILDYMYRSFSGNLNYSDVASAGEAFGKLTESPWRVSFFYVLFMILCGGMTYTFAKAQGGQIGKSICEDDKLDVALDVIKKAKENGVNLVLGTDCIAADNFANDANTQVCPANNIPEGWEGLDAGPETRKAFAEAIKGAKTILWNGPAGVFEFDNFIGGSKAIADAIAEATANGAFSLIGGGDSVACINKFGMADKVSYISTGGGALLEAIEGKVLPGVAAIEA